MMYQVKIIDVDGGTATASDGTLLRIAGNNSVTAGSVQWTDGQIIYGNRKLCGGGYVPVSEEGYLWLEEYYPDGSNEAKQILYLVGANCEKKKICSFERRVIDHIITADNQCYIIMSDDAAVYNMLTGGKIGTATRENSNANLFNIDEEGNLLSVGDYYSSRWEWDTNYEPIKSYDSDCCALCNETPVFSVDGLAVAEQTDRMLYRDVGIRVLYNVTRYTSRSHNVYTNLASPKEIPRMFEACPDLSKYISPEDIIQPGTEWRERGCGVHPQYLKRNGEVSCLYTFTAEHNLCVMFGRKMDEIRAKANEIMPDREEEHEKWLYWGSMGLHSYIEGQASSYGGVYNKYSYVSMDEGRYFYNDPTYQRRHIMDFLRSAAEEYKELHKILEGSILPPPDTGDELVFWQFMPTGNPTAFVRSDKAFDGEYHYYLVGKNSVNCGVNGNVGLSLDHTVPCGDWIYKKNPDAGIVTESGNPYVQIGHLEEKRIRGEQYTIEMDAGVLVYCDDSDYSYKTNFGFEFEGLFSRLIYVYKLPSAEEKTSYLLNFNDSPCYKLLLYRNDGTTKEIAQSESRQCNSGIGFLRAAVFRIIKKNFYDLLEKYGIEGVM